MTEDYLGHDELNDIYQIIFLIMLIIVGVFFIQQHVRVMESHAAISDTKDKTYAYIEYEEVVDRVYKFTPYQVYMFGYYMDNWGPESGNMIDYVICGSSTDLLLSPNSYHGNLVQRNNMISGANNTSPSVRSVLDTRRAGVDMTTYWRGNSDVSIWYLSWTDAHSGLFDIGVDDEYITPENPGHIIEHNVKRYSWLIDPTGHMLGN